jgi:hypothetical protein
VTEASINAGLFVSLLKLKGGEEEEARCTSDVINIV